MKTKLLKKLRKEHAIVGHEVHVIKYMYSIKSLHYYRNGEDWNPKWGSYSFEGAKAKQRELILESVKKYR